MAYATLSDVQDRITRAISDEEAGVVNALLDDAAILIDASNTTANDAAKMVVSCRMVIRALGDGNDNLPVGATQGSMSGLGYSQSWTIGNSGSIGELYLTKTDRRLLKLGDMIGSHSPTEDLT